MTYFDDILNINGLLRQKMRRNAEASRNLQDRIDHEKAEYAKLHASVDDLLAQAEALAARLNVDVPPLPEEPIKAAKEEAEDCAQLLIRLPDNFDFARAFEELRKEAHDAGFTNVHPEDLLSREEMAQAEAFYEAVEERFERETRLRGKDIAILTAAVAARIICKMVFSLPVSKEEAPPAEPEKYWTGLEDVIPSSEEPPAPASASPALDAFSGVNLGLGGNAVNGASPILADQGGIGTQGSPDMPAASGGLLDSARSLTDTISKTEQVISRLTGRRQKTVGIKHKAQILRDRIPFDLPDNDYFARSDALGYNKWFGWVFGVLNIMTDTVTTKKMRSFTVNQPFGGAEYPTIVQKISTPLHLMLPVMTRQGIRDSLLAAVVREAGVLEFTKAPQQEVAAILSRTFQQEEKNLSVLQEVTGAAQYLPPDTDWGAVIATAAKDTAVAAFLNQLITAIHALMYNPEEDGPVEHYAIRTDKILTVSSAIAAVFNSLPAIIEKNPAKIDFGGVITACLNMFNSTRFWIDVKTNYLVSAYQPALEEQMAIVNKYFEFVPA